MIRSITRSVGFQWEYGRNRCIALHASREVGRTTPMCCVRSKKFVSGVCCSSADCQYPCLSKLRIFWESVAGVCDRGIEASRHTTSDHS